MMRNLLHKNRNASNHALIGLSQNRIEGLAESRMAGKDEHEGSCHILHLLYRILGLHGLMHVLGHKPKTPAQSLKQ